MTAINPKMQAVYASAFEHLSRIDSENVKFVLGEEERECDADRSMWAHKHRDTIASALRWEASKMDPFRLYNLAQSLGLTAVADAFPQMEVTNVEEKSHQLAAVEVANPDGAVKA